MAEEGRRKLAAIMFTDIVGYSATMQKNEDLGRDLRKRHKQIFQDCTARHQGKIIQYFGDGTLSVFESAVAAVECAVCMQRSLHIDPQVPVRIGIHLGDIHYDDTEVYGHGVNVAARIEPVCNPGGIFISDKVYDEIKNHSSLKAKSLGTFQFKNINREVGLYAVHAKGILHPNASEIAFIKELTQKANVASAAEKSEAIQRYMSMEKRRIKRRLYRWAGVATFLLVAIFAFSQWQNRPSSFGSAPDDQEISIAVLPFTNMSSSDENDYFSDGMTEDILTLLSKIHGLSVTSRTSIMQYKDTDKDTRRIARELGVNHLLEGSVRRDGNQVRITAQLIDAINDDHLWAKTYDEELTSIFAVQSQVAEDIAKHLRKNLTIADHREKLKERTKDYTAYDHYLKGRQHYRRYTKEDNDKAIELFSTALEIDPEYSSAMAGLGDAYAQKGKWGEQHASYLDSAVNISKRAISLDPDLSEGHKSLGLVYQYQGKIDSALNEYEIAMELDPYNDMASNNIGMIHRQKGDFKESAKWIQRTFDLNRTVPTSTMNLAGIYMELGDDQTAKMIMEEGLQAHPENHDLQMVKGQILLREGNYDEAKKIGTQLIDGKPASPSGHAFLGDVYLQEKNWQKAGQQFEVAIAQMEKEGAQNTEMLEAQYALTEFQQGNQEWAQEKWLAILKKIEQKEDGNDKKEAETCLFKSGIYASLGMEEQALQSLEEAKNLNWIDYKAGVSHPAFEIFKGNPVYEKIILEVQQKSDSLKTALVSLRTQASQ